MRGWRGLLLFCYPGNFYIARNAAYYYKIVQLGRGGEVPPRARKTCAEIFSRFGIKKETTGTIASNVLNRPKKKIDYFMVRPHGYYSRLHDWGSFRGGLLLLCSRRSWKDAALMLSSVALTPPDFALCRRALKG